VPAGLRILGDARALALAGAPSASDGAAVHLGDPVEPPAAGDVVWLPGPAPEDLPPGARVIATAGDGLWSRAPWPARDDLFELPPPDAPHALVVGDETLRAEVLDKIAGRGVSAAGADVLTAEDLARASAVALLDGPGLAPAVLAARRILVAPRSEVTFGLLPGTDHLAFGHADEVVQYLDAVLSFPLSFEPFAVLGAVAAERWRASLVYARLADELARDGATYPSARAD
jgi:hypothetical protein